jgi:hypothetical protein
MDLAKVFAHVEQHVGDRIADLARSFEHSQVIPSCKYGPRSPEDTVGGSGQACRDGFHPASQRTLRRSFDDHVQMIIL